jgi:FlaA1/EpsC-like NDP-sugar epimerase
MKEIGLNMSSPKFRDLPLASKTLTIIEFILFAVALPSALYLNDFILFVSFTPITDNYLFVYALVFALLNQLSSLALGLYNSKLRVNFRGVIRRLLMCIAVAFFLLTIINPFYGKYALPIEVLAFASLIRLIVISTFRYFTFQLDFFGFNKRVVIVLGAGERASIIERRMRRDVDRQNFSVHGYVIMEGDSEE